MAETTTVERIGPGVYCVRGHGAVVVVYVAGPPGRRSAFANGCVYHEQPVAASTASASSGSAVPQALAAPMPATVLKVCVRPGAIVAKGDTLIVLEAMKMELPLRATADGVVVVVRCQEGQLVTPDVILVELTASA